MDNELETSAPEPRLYEVGYHILPTVAEEDIPQHASRVKSAIETLGGTVMSDGMPAMMTLAYSLPKVVANKRKIYTQAFFGWVKFEMTPENAVALKKVLDADNEIIRYIIIKTVVEKLAAPSEKMTFFTNEKKDPSAADEAPKKTKEKAPAPEVSAELDKTIDDLVIE